MNTSPARDEHPNITRYYDMINAFNRGDLKAASAFLDPTVVYTLPGRSPLACCTHGVAAHIEVLRRARERSGGTLRLEPRAVAAAGDYVFVYGRITATRAGKRLDSDHCVVFRYSNGRVVEGRTVPVDQYAFDAFWE